MKICQVRQCAITSLERARATQPDTLTHSLSPLSGPWTTSGVALNLNVYSEFSFSTFIILLHSVDCADALR